MNMLRNPNNLRLDLFGLDVACEILGCMNAWVSRHSGTICQMLLMLDNAMDDDIELKNILTKSAKKSQISNLFLLPWKNDTLLCAPIVATDGYTYLLGMIFPGHFQVTDRVSGVVDGLRCCLHALINQRLVVHHSELMKPQGARSRVCSCCRRMDVSNHGWMHWDDYYFLKTGSGCAQTVCEKCALALYDDVLQDNI